MLMQSISVPIGPHFRMAFARRHITLAAGTPQAEEPEQPEPNFEAFQLPADAEPEAEQQQEEPPPAAAPEPVPEVAEDPDFAALLRPFPYPDNSQPVRRLGHASCSSCSGCLPQLQCGFSSWQHNRPCSSAVWAGACGCRLPTALDERLGSAGMLSAPWPACGG